MKFHYYNNYTLHVACCQRLIQLCIRSCSSVASVASYMYMYLITWNFHNTFILRFWGVHISQHLNFTILRKFCSLNHFKFASSCSLFPQQCYLSMSLNLVNQLYQRYNKVKINKNATAGLYVSSNMMWVT